jgi:hypothetical protein
MSPPIDTSTTSPPTLPPLVTASTNTPRRTPSQQHRTSWLNRRVSNYSSTSRTSQRDLSRPASYVFPAFHSSLSYTFVRDFAYPSTHPMHYGPPPTRSGVSTPASEARRLSDPVVAQWEDSRYTWSATPPWMSEASGQTEETGQKAQLPAMSFSDGGPPYSEDEDLHSPIVTSSRHRKIKSQAGFERGRSPGDADSEKAILGLSGFDGEPGEAVSTYGHIRAQPRHRDSNFAKPLQRGPSPYAGTGQLSEEGSDIDEGDGRFSKDYSFTIASPDEEMHGKAVALFDFESEHENELPLKEGQIILVSYRHGQGWLVAEDPRTGESGLVPEEFVRLAREIEGGLNGLLDDNGEAFSPTGIDLGTAITPTPAQQEFPAASQHASRPSGEKHPPVQSTFSMSSRDFSPFPSKADGSSSPVKTGAEER